MVVMVVVLHFSCRTSFQVVACVSCMTLVVFPFTIIVVNWLSQTREGEGGKLKNMSGGWAGCTLMRRPTLSRSWMNGTKMLDSEAVLGSIPPHGCGWGKADYWCLPPPPLVDLEFKSVIWSVSPPIFIQLVSVRKPPSHSW